MSLQLDAYAAATESDACVGAPNASEVSRRIGLSQHSGGFLEPIVERISDRQSNNSVEQKSRRSVRQTTGANVSFLGAIVADEVLVHLFSYLDAKSLARCARVSKRFVCMSCKYSSVVCLH